MGIVQEHLLNRFNQVSTVLGFAPFLVDFGDRLDREKVIIAG